MSTSPSAPPGRLDRFLDGIERVGNRLPEPFMLFVLLTLVVAVLSSVMAAFGVGVTIPGEAEPTPVRGALSGAGLEFFFTGLAENFIGFPPLRTVVTIMLAVGLAERCGLLAALIRLVFSGAPRWLLPYALGFVGVSGSVMADSAFIIIPPLAAIVFTAAGRHPVAGLIGGFAAVGAGYSTSLLVTSLDALLAGITNGVATTLPVSGTPVTPISNYFYNAVSAVVLSLIAGLIIDRVVEPGLVRSRFPDTEAEPEEALAGGGEADPTAEPTSAAVTPAERRGLVAAGVALLVLVAAVLALVFAPDSPLRNDAGGYLPKSPLLDSVVTLVFLGFFVPALFFGIYAGTIRRGSDVPLLMGRALKDLSGFIVLAFILGQFIALFAWTNIGAWLAVTGAEFLQAIGLTGYPAILGFVVLASLLNLFVVSGSSLWTLMASVFVPMFLLLGYEPAFIQGAFRVGDAATQVVTPLNPYMIVLLTFVRRYQPEAGLGTVIAKMVPFVVPFWVAWVLVLTVFYAFGIPLGPGVGVRVAP